MDREAHISDSQLQYIARISHGKDSLKMLDVIFTRGLPLDRITTSDIWATDTIRGENPKMVEFKERADEYIWRKYRIEVEHLCAMKDGEKVTYEKLFYHVPKRKEKNAGRQAINGFPTLWIPWCQSGLKREARWSDPGVPRPDRELVQEAQNRLHPKGANTQALVQRGQHQRLPCQLTRKGTWWANLKTWFLKGPAARGGKNIVEYIGIAADEPKRFGQLNARKRAPLVEFGIEEGLCGLYCQYEGILGPAYDTGCRDGCWMCHNQGVNQLRLLRRDYPQLWALLLKWDVDSPVSFHPDGHTVHDFDRRFRLEDEHLLIPGDPRFRWSQLDEDLNYRWF